jgi:DNA-binding NtrC family response regulator
MSDAPPTTAAQQAAPRVLLVDDEPHITSALMRELRAEGFDLKACNDSQEAMRIATESEFALIVSDNLMPGMTGLEFLGNLKVRFPETRRILLTGHTELTQAVQAFNSGDIHRFVNKPWNKDDLLAIIRAELKAYREVKEKAETQTKAEQEAKQRSAQLAEVFSELKQARTQLTLHEEGALARQVHLSPRMRKIAALVVDSHDGVREILVNTLRKTGIENVSGIATANDALNWLQRSPAMDVIIAEWKLSDIDGLTLFKAIRSSNFLSAKTPFILISTRENRKAVEVALESGVNSYLIKPFHLTTLLDHIENQLPKGKLEDLEEKIKELRKLFYVVVNADLDSRSRIQNLLSASGVQDLVTSPNGTKALRLILDKNPQVLIYDCNVRDPNWRQVLDELRLAGNKANAPALVVTSVTPMQKEFEEVNKAGIKAFIPGEVHRQKLFEAIMVALDERDLVLG